MPKIVVSITAKQQRTIRRRIKKAGKGSISTEIRKALSLYLAGPRGIERAFLKLLEEKAPKDLHAMLAKFKKTNAEIRRTLKQIKKERERPTSLQGVNNSHLQELTKKALEVFGSADKANEWFFRPNRSLGGRTPFDLLTTQAGAKRIESVLGRIQYGVHS